MDFRGAVLRGWRLLVLLAVLGAGVGLLTSPGGGPNPALQGHLYLATVIMGPTGKANAKGTVTDSQLFLDVKNPTVLTDVAAKSQPRITASQLSARIIVTTARAALGLPRKGYKNIRPHGLGVTVRGVNPLDAQTLANAFPTALNDFLRKQAQGAYQHNVSATSAQITELQTQ